MNRIVITGATGFIGVHLIKEWMKRDAEIYAVVRPRSRNIERIPINENVHVVEMKMNEINNLPGVIDNADFFYHLAWEGARAPYRDDALLQLNNYSCAMEAFTVAEKIGCSFFLGSGSQAEYGSTNGLVDENYPCNPISEYGRQKLHACQNLRVMAEKTGLKYIWTRIFSIYGPYDYPGTLVMKCIEKMLQNEPIEMTAGTQLWDYLYVADAAKAMVMLAEKECSSGIYNIASGDYKPLFKYVEEIKESLKSESELLFGAIPYGPNGPVNLTPDPSKIKKAIGWTQTIDFRTGILAIATNYKKELFCHE